MLAIKRAGRFAAGLCLLSGLLVVTATDQVQASDGTGLNAQYFRGIALEGDPVLANIAPTINFDWGVGSPKDVPFNEFSARYSGAVVVPVTGEYTFYAIADDGVRLSVNATTVLNDWSDHPARQSQGTVTLTANERVPLRLEYYERRGRAKLRLEWSGPQTARQIVPTSQLFPTAAPPAITTTIAPTTVAPTTVAPTTVSPTTVAPPPTTAGTFYISMTGDDNNPGTQQAPWRTTKKATDTLTAGQTVLVGDGTYDNGLIIKRSGAPGRPITYAAAPGAKPIIRVTQPQDGGVSIEGASYIRIEGFDVSYQGGDASTDKRFQSNAGISAYADDAGVQPHHLEFIGNQVHDFPGQGIGTGQADYVTIEGNTIWNNSKWDRNQTSGISLYQTANVDFEPGFHNIIKGNVVFLNENRVVNLEANPSITDGNCIIIDDQRRRQNVDTNKVRKGPYESDTVIEDNICAGNGARGIHIFNSDNVLVRNNTLYNNLRMDQFAGDGELNAALYYDDEAADQTIARRAPARRGNIRFVNNLVVSNRPGAKFGTNDDRDRDSVVFQRNMYVGTRPLPPDGFGVLSSAAPDDIITNTSQLVAPNLFASQGDFRLRPGSSAIDAGVPENSPPFDLLGASRPYGPGPDIGAIEWRP